MSNSLANRQFLALARGEMAAQKPRNPFRVAMVGEQERYCLRCCGKQHFDVIFANLLNCSPQKTTHTVIERAAICRVCGHVVAHPELAKVKWIGGA